MSAAAGGCSALVIGCSGNSHFIPSNNEISSAVCAGATAESQHMAMVFIECLDKNLGN